MKIKSIKQAGKLGGKVVLLRTDYNVALDSRGKVVKDEIFRLERTIPTIKYLIKQRAKIVILTHLGRPGGKFKKEYSNKPLVLELAKILGKPVKMLPGVIENKIKNSINLIKPGQVVVLENLRFYPGEDKNETKFAKQLAELGDVYVNDAFAFIHRKNASMVAITKYLPSYAGLLLEEEIEQLTKYILKPTKPLMILMGGAKAETKIPFIKKLLTKADKIMLGGLLANTLLKSSGISIGSSVYEKKYVSQGKSLIKNKKVILPQDVICDIKKTKKFESFLKLTSQIQKGERVIDIGLKTAMDYANELRKAQTIFFNGPLGLIEKNEGAHASEALAEHLSMLATSKKTKVVVGGGETVAIFKKLNFVNELTYVSTGGGALLAFLINQKQPGIVPLIK